MSPPENSVYNRDPSEAEGAFWELKRRVNVGVRCETFEVEIP